MADSPDTSLWFEAEPDRLWWEINRFEELGLPVQQTVHSSGAVVLETSLPLGDGIEEVLVCFENDYPDSPPTFFAQPGVLERHQFPGEGRTLCWATDPDREWHPSRSVADIVDGSLRELFAAAAAGPEAVEAGEADMPEPLSGFIHYEPWPVVVVPDPFLDDDLAAQSGKMTLLTEGRRLMLVEANGLGQSQFNLRRKLMPRGKTERVGYWVAPDPAPDAALFNDTEAWDLAAVAPGLLERMKSTKASARSLNGSWLGVTFMEEGPARGEFRRNWAFARVELDATTGMTSRRWHRAQALTARERTRRIPELRGLDEAHVLVVGAGSLGCPLIFELAKAGVGTIGVIDNDVFDVNNAVRHDLPIECAGEYKAEAVAERASARNPFIVVHPHVRTINADPSAVTALKGLVTLADVVVDTTGSNVATRRLQRWCIELNRPLVIGGLTAGSYGGDIRVASPAGPCFDCFLLHASEEADPLPTPSEAPAGTLITPRGCSHPAFSGAGFDATNLAAHLARVVLQTTGKSGYPPAGFNWAVINFRSAPRWRSGTVHSHPNCHRHQ